MDDTPEDRLESPSRLRALWQGDVPLGEAFWLYAVGAGAFLNLLASLLFVLMNALGAPNAVAVTVFFLPVPYNVFAAVIVWRSAGRYEGPPSRALLARLAVVLLAVIASFT